AQRGTICEMRLERFASNQLHDVEEPAVGEPASVVDWDDTGMLETRERRGLRLEQSCDVGRSKSVRDLDGDVSCEEIVRRAIHRSHTAAPDLLDGDVSRRFELR